MTVTTLITAAVGGLVTAAALMTAAMGGLITTTVDRRSRGARRCHRWCSHLVLSQRRTGQKSFSVASHASHILDMNEALATAICASGSGTI